MPDMDRREALGFLNALACSALAAGATLPVGLRADARIFGTDVGLSDQTVIGVFAGNVEAVIQGRGMLIYAGAVGNLPKRHAALDGVQFTSLTESEMKRAGLMP